MFNNKIFLQGTIKNFREIQVLSVSMNEIQQWNLTCVIALFETSIYVVSVTGLGS